MKLRRLQRDADSIADDLEEDDKEIFEIVAQALGDFGDLPLGQAALDEAEKKGAAKDPLNSLVEDDADVRPQFMRDAEAERRNGAA